MLLSASCAVRLLAVVVQFGGTLRTMVCRPEGGLNESLVDIGSEEVFWKRRVIIDPVDGKEGLVSTHPEFLVEKDRIFRPSGAG